MEREAGGEGPHVGHAPSEEHLHHVAAEEGVRGDDAAWVPNVDAALELLRRQVEPGDVILVKASRAAGLERLAEALVSGEVIGR